MTDIVIVSGTVELPARLVGTYTARIIAQALPLYLTAIFWGRLIELDVHIEAYREPDAVQLASLGQLLYSPERDDIVIPYGATPISRAGEIRLQAPANIWAQALEDVQVLREVHDGAKVTIARYGTVRAQGGKVTVRAPSGLWRG